MSLRSRHGQRGAAAVEGALALLTFFTVLFAIMEAARFVNVQQALTSAAREGARFAVAPLQGTSNLPTDPEIQARVTQFLDAAGITGATISIQRPIIIPTGVVPVATEFTRIQVLMQYQVISIAMFAGNLQVTLSGEALMRNETSP
jgi:Flp pilus assembly protein TadG